ncbi:MAG: chemotaxis protein CheW [Candidatus Sulfobium sp.]|jgi:purine-binding chemotaxis protein CheW
MDIAKIRKKAKEKELKAAQKHEGPAGEEIGPAAGPPEVPAEETDTIREVSEEAEDPAGEDLIRESGPLPEALQTEAVAIPYEEEREEPHENEAPSSEATVEVLELLSFTVAEKEFAFRIADVEEIIPYQGITLVPLLPHYVSGITSLRGKIIPVIDLKSRFALGQARERSTSSGSPETNGAKGKILILSGPKGIIGATVDKIKGVVRFPEDSMLAPPAHLTEEERKFIDGVVIQEKRFISIVRFGDAMNIELG